MKSFLVVAALLAAVPAYAAAPEINKGMEQCRPHFRATAPAGAPRWDAGWEHCWKILNAFNRAQDEQAAAASASQVDAAKNETKALSDRLPAPSAQPAQH